jgi:hypothetical protein
MGSLNNIDAGKVLLQQPGVFIIKQTGLIGLRSKKYSDNLNYRRKSRVIGVQPPLHFFKM